MATSSSDRDLANQLLGRIASCMQRDSFQLRKSLRKILDSNKPASEELAELSRLIEKSRALVERRRAELPSPELDSELPIFDRRDEIAKTIHENQVVVISGETGSGKSTQLPLIALQMGIGIRGFIGHTQPRRIAARSVANRIASHVSTSLGDKVGFKIRFDDKTKDTTYIKLMTDGILLAETQSDRFLDQYEMIIIDEAHERSLNIDFLIGNLKRILQRRPDLKLIITSATIDTDRFAAHFASPDGKPAPVIKVEGRTYPVEIRYRPADESGFEDPIDHITESVREVIAAEHGDVLVFLPTEKDIKSVSKKLKGSVSTNSSQIEVLPLYARLSSEQQNSIFNPGKSRRVVLATNVAESSITVPRIRIVVDSGTARVSRYAPRSKVQRLPIEAISQASANQRAGRCGRIGPGVCLRLFSQEDFEGRTKFTTPEIRRTNLASVILQTLALRLGDITEFPFIDPPHPDAIRDGFKTLFEIGAIDHKRKLNRIGKWLFKLPVDPRIGRMLYAANEEGCLNEILIIAAALEVQDPRVRPAERQKAADEQHKKFQHEKSDFMSYLKLWDFFHQLRNELSRSKFRKACQQNFISLNLIHQWQEIHRQLKGMVRQLGLKTQPRKDDYNAIHRSLLTGLLSGIATITDKYEYTGSGGLKFHLWPGSGIFASKPKWVVVSEIVETAKRYGRTAAKIAPEWIEPLAGHLAKYHFVDPHWSKKQQAVLAYENVTLFGLPIVNRRRKHYGKIDPEVSRQLFIENGLAEFQVVHDFGFLKHNKSIISEIENSAAKTRRRDWLIDSAILSRFYDQNLPNDAVDVQSLLRIMNREKNLDSKLRLTYEDLGMEQSGPSIELFPDQVSIAGMQIPIEYRFEPGHQKDGATIVVPQEAISQINETQAGWFVPGLNEARITSLIKSLPKSVRRHFIPAPETAKKVIKNIDASCGSFDIAVAKELSKISGETVNPEWFSKDKLEQCLLLNFEVVDEDGKQVAIGRNINELRKSIGAATDNFVQVEDSQWHQNGLKDWNWENMPPTVSLTRGNTVITLHPAVVDQGDCVGLRLVDNSSYAKHISEQGLTRLFAIKTNKSLRKQINWLPDFDTHAVLLSSIINSEQLKKGLKDMIARMAIIDSNKILPDSKPAFLKIVDNSIESISIGTQRIAKWLPQFARAVHAANLSTETLPSQFVSARRDIESQITSLTGPEFLSSTHWNWLQHFPRYFSAIEARCEKLKSGGNQFDRSCVEQITQHLEKLNELSDAHARLNIHDPELLKLRWMIEEFRVSLFAQKLGTSLTVSETRLNKQLAKVTAV